MLLVWLLAAAAIFLAIVGGRATHRDLADRRWAWTIAGALATLLGTVIVGFLSYLVWWANYNHVM